MVLTHTHVFVLVTMEVIVKMNVSKNDFFFQKYFIPTHSNTKGVYVVFSVFSFSRFQMGFSKNAECGFVGLLPFRVLLQSELNTFYQYLLF